MPISGTDLAITPARAGILRSGAGRSGWPILQGVRVPLYALSGVGRSGAMRSNYVSPKTFISIGGTHYGTGNTVAGAEVLLQSLSIHDGLDEIPNTAQMRTMGFYPSVGQDAIITLGSKNNLTRFYAGKIIRSQQSYLGKPGHYCHDLSLIDSTWGLDKRLVTGHYTGSATTIVLALMAAHATSYTTRNVQAGLPTVDGGITFTKQPLSACLTQIAKRIGARGWTVDYTSDLHFHLTADTSVTRPTPINVVNRLFMLDGFSVSRDVSQFVTRMVVEGGGSAALEAVAIGETIIPVTEAEWYQAAGGVVVSGPQRITYTTRLLGGGGALVGPGASPSAAPAVTSASGSGVETGPHDYAVSFVTASGESLAGPHATITLGALAAPITALAIGTPTIGTGPDPGTHDYATTFVTSAGETTASPLATVATTLTPAPTTAPTAAAAIGAGVDNGPHDYAVSFITVIGETTPSSISGTATTGPVTTGFIDAPVTAPTPTAIAGAAGIDDGTHYYATTDITAAGETTLSPLSAAVATGPVTSGFLFGPTTAPAPTAFVGLGVDEGVHDYAVSFLNPAGETTSGPFSATVTLEEPKATALDTPDALTITADGAGNLRGGLYSYGFTFANAYGETTLGDLATRAVSGLLPPSTPLTFDITPDYGVSITPPSVVCNVVRTPSTGFTLLYAYDFVVTFANALGETTAGPIALGNVYSNTTGVALTGIPLGGAGTTKRRIYRRAGNDPEPTQFWWIADLNDNTTTTLGTATGGRSTFEPPTTNTTANGPVHATYDYLTTFLNAAGETPGPTGTSLVRSIASLSRSGNTATVQTSVDHGFMTGNTITIAGATPANYNGTFMITVSSANEFDYPVSGSPATPATGTMTATFTGGPSTTVVIHTNTTRLDLLTIPIGPAGTTKRRIYRRSSNHDPTNYLYYTEIANNTTNTLTSVTIVGTLGATTVPTANTTGGDKHALSAIQVGPTGTIARKVYRTVAGGTDHRLLTTISNNTGTTFSDNVADGSLGALAPTNNTTAETIGDNQVSLSGIPIGATGTTGRNLYRRSGGLGLKLVGLISGNSTTTYIDSTPNASLGAAAPTTNTTATITAYNHVSLSLPAAGTGATGKKLYRQSGAAGMKLVSALSAGATTYTDSTSNASLGATAPTSNTTATITNHNQVALTGIPLGDANVTSRKLYRRSGGLGLKLVTTIANNTGTTYTDSMANASLGAAVLTVSTAYLQRIPLSDIPNSLSPLVTSVRIYGTPAGSAQLKLIATIANGTASYTVTTTDASLGANIPTVNTAAANQVALTGIPIGAAAVTSRKVYRTVAGGVQLKLQQTIANNTASVGVTDATADASLGANAPTVDNSGLQQPEGNVPAGSTSLIAAGTGAFSATGGWAVIGNGQQVIRYTGTTGSALTGIPASGPGAVVATVGYNSTVTAAPCLIGIPASGTGAIQYPILKGDDVNLLVQIDDVAAQAVLAALIGGDGIQEDHIQDRRLAFTEATARGEAHLAQRNQVDVAITYRTHDINTRAGQTISINLGTPTNVIGSFTIQSVTATTFSGAGVGPGHVSPLYHPTFTVQAASSRFSFEDLLRLAKVG